ncbi:Anaerobic ribonucleoside-triphosphate reductase-activating protein [bioreactor metagenome]|uniref:Anaerobic ribonucleoside-triphosphate reductase-activating protein n=1 Tax=bioreactor metagenome TaxID=1076179 RepID=A0A644T3X0_9ZZZZ|nr:anaerobic ribonucleoside-triphosphate reductase activating protein [Negativicutes bacterium]
MIRYSDIISESVVDGQGIRVAAFLQGCPRHCNGCHNPELLPMVGGIEAGEKEFAELILSKITPLHKGITFSGGDPLVQAEALLKVIFLVKRKNPKLDIWVYTGFTFEEIMDLPVLSVIDFLVDGPFVAAQKDLRLPFRGSTNQRIIDVSRSLTTGRVVELEINDGYSKAV